MNMTLGQQMAKLYTLFGTRNSLYMPGIMERMIFLDIGIRNLEDGVHEKKVSEHRYLLASIFARICAVDENFTGLSVPTYMSRKYPRSGCIYCNGSIPCKCSEVGRGPEILSAIDPVQMTWSVREWQTHLDSIYGDRNRKKGIDRAILGLFSEAAELKVLPLAATPHADQENLVQNYGLESADMIARLMGASNILEVDLQDAIEETYGGGCSKCHKPLICRCGAFNVSLRKTYEALAHSTVTAHTTTA